MFLLTAATEINPNTAALVGYIVMALALVLIAIVAVAVVKRVIALVKKSSSAAVAESDAQTAPAPAPVLLNDENKPLAPDSAGQLKLHDVDPKTAAMLMAIVADKTGKPLNELRFISIKEIK